MQRFSRSTRAPLLAGLGAIAALALVSCAPPASARQPGGTPRSEPEQAAYGVAQAAEAELHELERVGGASRAVAVDGDHVYLGEGPRLLILDVSDPTDPVLISRSEALPWTIQELAVGDGVAVVLAGYGGHFVTCEVWAFDVTDVSTPRIAGRLGDFYASGMHLVGDRLFLAVAGTLAVFERPTRHDTAVWSEVGRMVLGEDYEYGMDAAIDVVGDLAYIGTNSGELLVADVSDPGNMRVVGRARAYEGIRNIEVDGGYVYAAEGIASVMIAAFDISDPTRPERVGECNTQVGDAVSFGLQVESGSVYVALGQPSYEFDHSGNVTGGGTLLSCALNDREWPRLAWEHHTPGSAEALAVRDGLAYVADGSGGLRVIDVGGSEQPTEVGHFDHLGRALDLALAGDTIAVADGVALRVVDSGNLAHMKVAGSADAERHVGEVALHAGHAIVADASFGGFFDRRAWCNLRIYDLADRSQPREVASLEVEELSRVDSMVVGPDDCLFVGSDKLHAVDVSDPQSPVALDIDDFAFGYVHAMAMAGDHLLVARSGGTRPSGLDVIDVGESCSATLVSSTTLNDPLALAVDDSFAYAVGHNQLTTISLADPAAPQVMGSLADRLHNPRDMAVTGGLAYVLAGRGEIVVIDVSDPASPRTVGTAHSLGHGRALEAVDGTLYLADGHGGLAVLRHGAVPPGDGRQLWLPAASR